MSNIPDQEFFDFLDIPHLVKEHSRPDNKKLLSRNDTGTPRKHYWHYQYAVGMMSYMQGLNCPDISMAVHQCARFLNNPRLIHERAVKTIANYFSETATRGTIYDTDKTQGIECYVDANFSGGWDRDNGQRAENDLSWSSFAIFYSGSPILWASKLQMEIYLITA